MIIVHIESGLGNQMLSYCELLALKKINPDAEIYIEDIIYEIPECNNVIKQWNGYELDRVFDIHPLNIRSLFPNGEWKQIILEVRESEFWNHNWNYPVYITEVLNKHGLNVKNIRGNFESKDATLKTGESASIKSRIGRSYWGYQIKKIYAHLFSDKKIKKKCDKDMIFYQLDKNESIFTGQRLSLKNIGNGIELIEKEIRSTFVFPGYSLQRDVDFSKYLKSVNAVAIHARRGDLLGINSVYYQYGYFKKAVKYIKTLVEKPVFVFFCDPGSISWCRDNPKIFGLDINEDSVLFVDWHTGQESFRDMQLMAECKHQIITNSSFGWWGAYLNTYAEKITISPMTEVSNTTHHF